jgi:hypothetical protein
MARDDAGPGSGSGSGERRYIYSKCATCHTKVHVAAFYCPRCKNRTEWNANKKEWEPQTVYGSRNPEDLIYGVRLCGVDRCMVCEAALGGHPCRYAVCYGTGRGNCALCERYEARRYACCQAARKENAAARGAIQNDPAGGAGEQ